MATRTAIGTVGNIQPPPVVAGPESLDAAQGEEVLVPFDKQGATALPCSVRVQTVPGSAIAGRDYNIVDEVVQFPPNDEQEFVLLRLKSTAVGGTSFLLRLSSPVDCTVPVLEIPVFILGGTPAPLEYLAVLT